MPISMINAEPITGAGIDEAMSLERGLGRRSPGMPALAHRVRSFSTLLAPHKDNPA